MCDMDKTIVQSSEKLILVFNSKEEIEIEPNDILGRGEKGKEFFKDKTTVSRKHAQLIFNDFFNYWYLKDLNSTNGTYLNGKKLEKEEIVKIKNGDEIMLSHSLKLICILGG